MFWHDLCILLGSPTASGDDAQRWGCDQGDVEGDGQLLYLTYRSCILSVFSCWPISTTTIKIFSSVWFVCLCSRIVRCLWDIQRKAAPDDTKRISDVLPSWYESRVLAIQQALLDASSSLIWYLTGLRAQDWLSGIQMMMRYDENLSVGNSTYLDRWWRRKSCFISSFLHWASWFAQPLFIRLRVELKIGVFRIWASCSPQLWCSWYSRGEKRHWDYQQCPCLWFQIILPAFSFWADKLDCIISHVCESRNNHCDCEVIWPLQACWILRSHLNSLLSQELTAVPFFPWPLLWVFPTYLSLSRAQ